MFLEHNKRIQTRNQSFITLKFFLKKLDILNHYFIYKNTPRNILVQIKFIITL